MKITIKNRTIDKSFRKIIESGIVYFEVKGEKMEMRYEFENITDDYFSEYESDVKLDITKEMEKNLTPDQIDELRDFVEDNFDNIKVI